MILDVHSLYLKDAIDEILYKFDECKECGDDTLQIIHGHKHGTMIKDYVRSSGFISEMAKNGNEVIESSFSKEGVTIFKLKLLSTSSKRKPILESSTNVSTEESILSLEICYKCNETMILLKDYNWYKYPKCGKLKKETNLKFMWMVPHVVIPGPLLAHFYLFIMITLSMKNVNLMELRQTVLLNIGL